MPPPAPLAAIVTARADHRALIDVAGARRWPTSCRCWRATAASSAPATGPSSTSSARCATTAASVAALEAQVPDGDRRGPLKIRHNNVLGYYIEVTATHADKLDRPRSASSTARRWPTMRFTTVELAELETPHRPRRRPGAGDRAGDLRDLVGEAMAGVDGGRRAPAAALAALDVAAALAELAAERQLRAAAVERRHAPSSSTAAAIRWSRRRCSRQGGRASSPNDCELGRRRGGCGCSPAPTWPASRPSCARTR